MSYGMVENRGRLGVRSPDALVFSRLNKHRHQSSTYFLQLSKWGNYALETAILLVTLKHGAHVLL